MSDRERTLTGQIASCLGPETFGHCWIDGGYSTLVVQTDPPRAAMVGQLALEGACVLKLGAELTEDLTSTGAELAVDFEEDRERCQ